MLEFVKRYLDALEFDFVKWRYMAAAFSGLLMLASWGVFIGIGPNWGIDFTGGTEIHIKFEEATDIGAVRSALRAMDLSDDAVMVQQACDGRPPRPSDEDRRKDAHARAQSCGNSLRSGNECMRSKHTPVSSWVHTIHHARHFDADAGRSPLRAEWVAAAADGPRQSGPC